MTIKVLTYIKSGDKYLALRNNPLDPKHGGDFWYVVTGNVKKNEKLVNAVKREILEETGLVASSVIDLNLPYEFENQGKMYKEYCFLAEVKSEQVALNNENIDYQWLSLDEFMAKIQLFDDKEKIKQILRKH